jgi:signal transduction histidine kinase
VVEVHLTRIPDHAGQLLQVALHLHDLSWTRAEERRRGDFLSLISHKLFTPLASILGWADLCREELADDAPEVLHTGLDEILAGAVRLRDLTETLLTYASLAAPTLTLHRRPCEVADVVAQAERKVREKHPGVVLDLRTTPATDVETWLADPQLFALLFEVLLDNAIKFNDKARVEVTWEARAVEAGARFTVTDNGPGIAPDVQDRIFDTFYQIDRYFTGSIPGAGLGLALARRIVEAHGGTINVITREGHGSSFIFDLPAPEETE